MHIYNIRHVLKYKILLLNVILLFENMEKIFFK